MAWTWLGHGLDTGEKKNFKKKEKKRFFTTRHNLKHQLGFEILKFRPISLFLALKSQRFLISLADLQLIFTEPASLVLLCKVWQCSSSASVSVCKLLEHSQPDQVFFIIFYFKIWSIRALPLEP